MPLPDLSSEKEEKNKGHLRGEAGEENRKHPWTYWASQIEPKQCAPPGIQIELNRFKELVGLGSQQDICIQEWEAFRESSLPNWEEDLQTALAQWHSRSHREADSVLSRPPGCTAHQFVSREAVVGEVRKCSISVVARQPEVRKGWFAPHGTKYDISGEGYAPTLNPWTPQFISPVTG